MGKVNSVPLDHLLYTTKLQAALDQNEIYLKRKKVTNIPVLDKKKKIHYFYEKI